MTKLISLSDDGKRGFLKKKNLKRQKKRGRFKVSPNTGRLAQITVMIRILEAEYVYEKQRAIDLCLGINRIKERCILSNKSLNLGKRSLCVEDHIS